MTQRPERQPEDIDSPLLPAADPDLEDGTEVRERQPGKTDADENEPSTDDRDSNSN
jgi:hypothetical protein